MGLQIRDRSNRIVLVAGYVVLPKRWIVERIFAWLGRNRILSKEYERLTQTSESDVYIASIRLMLRRLDRRQTVPNF